MFLSSFLISSCEFVTSSLNSYLSMNLILQSETSVDLSALLLGLYLRVGCQRRSCVLQPRLFGCRSAAWHALTCML